MRGWTLPVALFVAMSAARLARAETNALWFPVGERLVYRLYWGVVPVGWAELWTEWTEDQGKRLLRIAGQARSGAVIKRIYPVDDFVESIVDPVTFLPVRYNQRLKEGRHLRDDHATFNHAARSVHWESGKDGSSTNREIAADSRDVLSFMYYMRSKGFSVGEQEQFQVFVDEKMYSLELTGLAEESTKVRGFGAVQCLKVEPKAKFGEIFVRRGKVLLWLSADSARIPTRMTAKVPLASIKGLLWEVRGHAEGPWRPPDEGHGAADEEADEDRP